MIVSPIPVVCLHADKKQIAPPVTVDAHRDMIIVRGRATINPCKKKQKKTRHLKKSREGDVSQDQSQGPLGGGVLAPWGSGVI